MEHYDENKIRATVTTLHTGVPYAQGQMLDQVLRCAELAKQFCGDPDSVSLALLHKSQEKKRINKNEKPLEDKDLESLAGPRVLKALQYLKTEPDDKTLEKQLGSREKAWKEMAKWAAGAPEDIKKLVAGQLLAEKSVNFEASKDNPNPTWSMEKHLDYYQTRMQVVDKLQEFNPKLHQHAVQLKDAGLKKLCDRVNDFQECLRYTDAALKAHPASDIAAAWTQRLGNIANNAEQSTEDRAHSRFKAELRQARLLGTDGHPTEQATNTTERLLRSATAENDFEKCLRYTDAAIEAHPASDIAAAWTQCLGEIAENPEQSPEDLAHRKFKAELHQTRLLGADGRPTEQAIKVKERLLKSATAENDFENCVRPTDAAIEFHPGSDIAAAWTQRLVKIAENSEQSAEDLAHRPFEAYLRQLKLRGAHELPKEQAMDIRKKLIRIANAEKTPSAKEHRLREAHYCMATQGHGREQIASAKTLLALTKRGSPWIRNSDQKVHWEFLAFDAASRVEGFSPRQRMEYAEQAQRCAIKDGQRETSRDFRNSNAKLPLARLADATSWGR